MGSTSWHSNLLQALLIQLLVQIVTNVLCVFWTSLWASLKERMAHPATDGSMAEFDLELGMVNVGGGATILGTDNPNGCAANSGIRDDGKIEYTEYIADVAASTPEARIPTPKAQCQNLTDDVTGVMDVSYTQQAEVLVGKEV